MAQAILVILVHSIMVTRVGIPKDSSSLRALSSDASFRGEPFRFMRVAFGFQLRPLVGSSYAMYNRTEKYGSLLVLLRLNTDVYYHVSLHRSMVECIALNKYNSLLLDIATCLQELSEYQATSKEQHHSNSAKHQLLWARLTTRFLKIVHELYPRARDVSLHVWVDHTDVLSVRMFNSAAFWKRTLSSSSKHDYVVRILGENYSPKIVWNNVRVGDAWFLVNYRFMKLQLQEKQALLTSLKLSGSLCHEHESWKWPLELAAKRDPKEFQSATQTRSAKDARGRVGSANTSCKAATSGEEIVSPMHACTNVDGTYHEQICAADRLLRETLSGKQVDTDKSTTIIDAVSLFALHWKMELVASRRFLALPPVPAPMASSSSNESSDTIEEHNELAGISRPQHHLSDEQVTLMHMMKPIVYFKCVGGAGKTASFLAIASLLCDGGMKDASMSKATFAYMQAQDVEESYLQFQRWT